MNIEINDLVKTIDGEYPVNMLLGSQVRVIGGYIILHRDIISVRKPKNNEIFNLDYKLMSFKGTLKYQFTHGEWITYED
jgi:hypothetical protein